MVACNDDFVDNKLVVCLTMKRSDGAEILVSRNNKLLGRPLKMCLLTRSECSRNMQSFRALSLRPSAQPAE